MHWTLIVISVAVFISLAIFMYNVLALHIIQHHFKRRLQHRVQSVHTNSYELIQNKSVKAIVRHLHLLLSSVRLSMRVNQFLSLTALLMLTGFVLGHLYFTQLSSVMICTLLFTCLPYIFIRGYLIHKRMEAQREFLPAVELFYQYYLISGGKQIKLALAKTVEEKGLLVTMQQNFTQLHRNLTIYPDIEYSLSIFSHATGHRWSNYFVQLLLVALNEGVSIKGGIKDLINDMRKARKQNEVERHRVLEIRIANFTPILFLSFFMAINLSLNFDQSMEAYFYDEAGRKMLLHSFVLMTLSLMMGIHLSRKRVG